jgi:hypothetical protein
MRDSTVKKNKKQKKQKTNLPYKLVDSKKDSGEE